MTRSDDCRFPRSDLLSRILASAPCETIGHRTEVRDALGVSIINRVTSLLSRLENPTDH